MIKFMKDKRGLTLLEVLIAMSISSVILLSVYIAFSQQSKSYKVQKNAANNQQSERFTIQYLGRKVRMAGAGMLTTKDDDDLKSGHFYVAGIDYKSEGTAPIYPAIEDFNGGEYYGAGVDHPDSIIIRYARIFLGEMENTNPDGTLGLAHYQARLEQEATTGQTFLIVAESLTNSLGFTDPGGVSEKAYPIMLTTPDSQFSAIFWVHSVDSGTRRINLLSTVYQVDKDDFASGGQAIANAGQIPAASAIPDGFPEGSLVQKIEWNESLFFVCDGENRNNRLCPTSGLTGMGARPTLYEYPLMGPVRERLAPYPIGLNIEDLQFEYFDDNGNTGTSTSALSETVTGVKIFLVSVEEDITDMTSRMRASDTTRYKRPDVSDRPEGTVNYKTRKITTSRVFIRNLSEDFIQLTAFDD